MGMYMALSLSVSLCVNFISRKKRIKLGDTLCSEKKKNKFPLSLYIIYIICISIYIYINKTLIIPSRERKNENNFK